MNVLIIGDEHAYGYGLSGKNRSYIGHFVRQLSQTGQSVSVEVYAHLTMSQTTTMLAQLPLSRYDLIVLQLDCQVLETARPELDRLIQAGPNGGTESAFSMPVLPYPQVDARPSSSIGQTVRSYGKAVSRLMSYYLKPLQKRMLPRLLNQLRPFRHNVVLVTPLPHQRGAERWLRSRLKTLVLREANRQLFSVFDTSQVIYPNDAYFLTDDTEHLNAVSHELLGRSLFDYYQSAPTIVTVQSRN